MSSCHALRKDPDLISSVTLLMGARGLLVGALKAICFPGKTCHVPSVSPHRSGAPDPKQSWNSLLKFASVHWCVSCICGWGLWYSGCGLMSTEQGNRPFSLLAVVLLTQPRKLLACAASAHCWLTFSSIHTKTFHWPSSQWGPACIVYSFPSAGQGFCSCWISEGSYSSVWRQVQDLPSSCSCGPVLLFSKVPLADEHHWMQPARSHGCLWAEFSWDTWVNPHPLLGTPFSNSASQCWGLEDLFGEDWGKEGVENLSPTCVHSH